MRWKRTSNKPQSSCGLSNNWNCSCWGFGFVFGAKNAKQEEREEKKIIEEKKAEVVEEKKTEEKKLEPNKTETSFESGN